MRYAIPAVIGNLLVPGTGLILLGKEWKGLGLAVGFGATAELAAIGLLLAPYSIPTWVSILALIGAIVIWLTAQGLIYQRIRMLTDPNLAAEVSGLKSTAAKAMEIGDLDSAWLTLKMAMTLDHRDLYSHILWARLMTRIGKPRKARRALRYAARLDHANRFKDEIGAAMRALEPPAS
jgi:hypothetical protein